MSDAVDILLSLGLSRAVVEDLELYYTDPKPEGRSPEQEDRMEFVTELMRAEYDFGYSPDFRSPVARLFRCSTIRPLTNVGAMSDIANDAYKKFYEQAQRADGDGDARMRIAKDAGKGQLAKTWLRELDERVASGTATPAEVKTLAAIHADAHKQVVAQVDRIKGNLKALQRRANEKKREAKRWREHAEGAEAEAQGLFELARRYEV